MTNRPPLPPGKDDDNHRQISPPFRAPGRSNPSSAESNPGGNNSHGSDQQGRGLLRHILARGEQALANVTAQPGMPERSDYETHDAWLRALLTSSLQQSAEIQRVFGHGQDHETHEEGDKDDDVTEDGQDEEDKGSSL